VVCFPKPLFLVSVCLASAPAVASQTSLLVVDDDHPADFASLQDAVDAAADGDVVLVRPGGYGDVTIDGKGVAIVADDSPVSIGDVAVRNLPLASRVLLRAQGALDSVGGVVLANDAGGVWIEGLRLRGSPAGGPVVDVAACQDVVLLECQVDPAARGAGDDGIRASGSSLQLYSCFVRGRDGRPGSVDTLACSAHLAGAPGGAALRLLSGEAFLGSCVLAGGVGGDGGHDPSASCPSTSCTAGGDGGPGLFVQPGAVARRGQATIVFRGPGGSPGAGCIGGANGQDVAGSGSSVDVGGRPHRFTATSPLKAGADGTLSFQGPPGELAFLTWALDFRASFFAPFHGSWLLPPGRVAFAGVVPFGTCSPPPCGALDVPIRVSSVAPAQALAFPMQALFVERNPLRVTLGAGSVLVVVE